MSRKDNRTFYYHADASAVGGFFKQPISAQVPVQAPISLSPSGGYAYARAEKFNFQELVRFEAAYTRVSGGVDEETGDWVTQSTAVIEGLNIADVVTVDRLVSHVATSQSQSIATAEPAVTIKGSSFDNVTVLGNPVTVTVDSNLLDWRRYKTDEERELEDSARREGREERLLPFIPLVERESFLKNVAQQYKRMNDPIFLPDWLGHKTIPAWIAERYNADDVTAKLDTRGFVLSSCVRETTGEFAGTPCLNVFDVPEFGRIFFAEVLADRNTHRVIGLRLELGCATAGDVAFGHVGVEGRPYP